MPSAPKNLTGTPAPGELSVPARRLIKTLITLLFIFSTAYLLVRWRFAFRADYTTLERFLAVLFLTAESFVVFQAWGYFGVMRKALNDKPAPKAPLQQGAYPPVAVLVPARHEPKEVLRRTFLSASSMDYPNKHLYFLDDSSDPKYMKEAEEVAEEFGATIFRRAERHGAKAGILNDRIKTLTEKYIAVFDADQCPMSGFLTHVVPFLEADPKLAFVQTPQFYSNIGATRIAHAANMQQAVFYEYICEGKSEGDAMFCCGTNVVFRREALESVGGFDETSVTEDFATSIKLQVMGWKAHYDGHVSTFGMAPEDFDGYFKQQFRWAKGNMSVLKTLIGQILRRPGAMRPSQWFEYLVTSCYYFIGWSYAILMLGPITYIFFSLPSYDLNAYGYTITFLPYMFLSLWIHWSRMRARHYEYKKLLAGQFLFYLTIPVYMQATLYGILGIKTPFQVTNKEGSKDLPFTFFWPQLLIWAVLLSASTWGLLRGVHERSLPVLINTFWVMTHLWAFSSLFYFKNVSDPECARCKNVDPKAAFDYKITSAKDLPPQPAMFHSSRCFGFASEKPLGAGSVLMCKLIKDGRTLIFDAEVVVSLPHENLLKRDWRILVSPRRMSAESERSLYEVYLK